MNLILCFNYTNAKGNMFTFLLITLNLCLDYGFLFQEFIATHKMIFFGVNKLFYMFIMKVIQDTLCTSYDEHYIC